MDMTTVDLSGVPEDAAGAGAWVEIFGPNASIERVAEQAGTIPYEILTGIGPRVERIRVGAGRGVEATPLSRKERESHGHPSRSVRADQEPGMYLYTRNRRRRSRRSDWPKA